MPENLNELIDEAERLAERAPHGNWVAKDWSVFTDGDACILVAYTATNNARRTPQHQATCSSIAHAHNLQPKLIAAYRDLGKAYNGTVFALSDAITARDKLTAELDRLRAQAERYRLDALRLAAKVDPEEFAAEWEAEIADLRTVREDLANERAVRARRELAVTRAIAKAKLYTHPGTNAGDHKVLSEMVEILEGKEG